MIMFRIFYLYLCQLRFCREPSFRLSIRVKLSNLTRLRVFSLVNLHLLIFSSEIFYFFFTGLSRFIIKDLSLYFFFSFSFSSFFIKLSE